MWEPVDYIALVIAIAIGAVLVITAVAFAIVPLITKQPISDERSKNVRDIIIFFAGVLLGYMTNQSP